MINRPWLPADRRMWAVSDFIPRRARPAWRRAVRVAGRVVRRCHAGGTSTGSGCGRAGAAGKSVPAAPAFPRHSPPRSDPPGYVGDPPPLACLDEVGPAQQRANRLRRAVRELMTSRGADLRYGRAGVAGGRPGRCAGDRLLPGRRGSLRPAGGRHGAHGPRRVARRGVDRQRRDRPPSTPASSTSPSRR